jgi:hypothetical protein
LAEDIGGDVAGSQRTRRWRRRESTPTTTATVEAAIAGAELAIMDEIDPPPARPRRRRKPTA